MRISEFELLENGVALAGEFSTVVTYEGKEKVFSLLIYIGSNLSVYSRVEEEVYQKISHQGWVSQGEGDFLRIEDRVENSLGENNLRSLEMLNLPLEDDDLLKFEAKATALQEEIYQLLHHELVKPRPKLRLV